ncbi:MULTISPECIES: hypothetical protein [Microbacterium]|uniref:Amidohydrolase 3 domain-containing protein n=1 Tax=Microbacterium wangchenii TaxID=2541726 RepID=A0ABX5SQE4_9MICO|nr:MULTISPECIES: hypothetical protein [Microbacterium]MCK6068218.1 hypothetical protein [Microbacterium sp. EYE_512]QBR87505.1 hypothetical protein E4K62_01630 [Microbacterium wangchenii]TXK15774.1 hypothetical protein FVP99_09730 [Microbacterium wangchenii]
MPLFDIFLGGARLLTSDSIADALLEYARVLTDCGRTQTVTFPVMLDGQAGTAWARIGAHADLVAVRTEPQIPLTLDGEEVVASELFRLAANVAPVPPAPGWRPT